MSVNASSHLHRVLIGTDQQDWSKSLVSLDLKQNKRDRGGLQLIDGTLVLAWAEGNPESLNPRSNPSRWHRGQVIKIEVTNRSGAFVSHPLGLIYVVKEPLPPTPAQPEITLQVGCVLTLRNYAQPDSNQSGVSPGAIPTGATRTQIINSMLIATKARPPDPHIPRIPPALLGFPNGYPEFLISDAPSLALTGSIPEYPIGYPLPKQGGSYVEQSGKVAFAAGYVIKQNRLGQIVPIKEELQPVTPLVTIVIGRDEIDYTPIEGSETPAEIVKATGTTQKLTSNSGTISSSELDYGSRVIGTKLFRNIPVRQVETIDTWELVIFASHKLQEIAREPAGSLKAVNPLGGSELIISILMTEEYSYGQNRRLTTHTKTLKRPRGVVLNAYHEFVKERVGDHAEFPSLTELIICEITVTDYTYDEKERTKRIEIVTRKPAGAVLPELGQFETSGAESLTPSQIVTKKWEPTRPDEWAYTEYTQNTLAETNPELKELEIYQPGNDSDHDIAELLELGSTTSKRETSRAGQSQPPAAEYAPPLYSQEEKQIKGYGMFALAAGADEQQRTRTIEVEYAVSSEQLSAIARTEGKILIGRRQGQQIQLPLLDEFLQELNLPRIDCIEPNGTTYCFLADNISYSHDPEKAIVGFDGIWIGTLV